MTDPHTCDRNGRPTRVVDESHDPPMTAIYPTCSVCGKPQAFGTLLSQLRGEDIGKARNSLPACRADSPETGQAAVEVPELGVVVITFRKLRHAHHKTRRWFWTPESAQLQD